MARIIYTDDLSAEGVRIFSELTHAQLRNRLEPEKGIFIAESPKVIGTALDAGYTPVAMLTEQKHIHGQAADIIERCGDIPVYTAEREKLAELAGYTLTRGVLCAFRRPEERSAQDVCADAKKIAVLEDIADSTNVGAIFRSAAALGVDAVLLTPSCCDPLCRRSLRVSMGTVLQVPWARICSTPARWYESGVQMLRDMGFVTMAMALDDDSVGLDSPVLKAAEKIAVLLGTEGDGLSRETVAHCDHTVKIPMMHGVDSLNVAAASAVAFWELFQRQGAPAGESRRGAPAGESR